MNLNNIKHHWRLWIIGLVIALSGVVVARVIAPNYTGKTAIVITGIGRLLALAGFVFIAFAIRKRNTDQGDNRS